MTRVVALLAVVAGLTSVALAVLAVRRDPQSAPIRWAEPEDGVQSDPYPHMVAQTREYPTMFGKLIID